MAKEACTLKVIHLVYFCIYLQSIFQTLYGCSAACVIHKPDQNPFQSNAYTKLHYKKNTSGVIESINCLADSLAISSNTSSRTSSGLNEASVNLVSAEHVVMEHEHLHMYIVNQTKIWNS